MGNIPAPVRLALNMSVHLGTKVSVQSYSKVKRVSTYRMELSSDPKDLGVGNKR